ncbi:MAG: hypothetical protein LBR60_07915 [Fibrobacter sp.]|jgi:hypothetical protein|nr:hypothetical protein [Fibrobacter sp.]
MNRLLFLIPVFLMFLGCANKSVTRYEMLSKPLEEGGFEAAIQKAVEEQDDLYGSNSEFLFHYDLGILYHYKGDWKQSAEHLAKAEEIYEELFARSVSNEAAALLTNDNVRPYRARPFELLSLFAYQILNYLSQNDIDGALVEVRRSQIAAEALYQKNEKKVNDAGYLRYLSGLVYEMGGEADNAAISYFQAVKAYDENKQTLPPELWEYVYHYLKKNGREDDIKSLGKAPPASSASTALSDEFGQEIVVVAFAGKSAILGELYMSGTFVNGGGLNLYYKDGETGKQRSLTIVAPFLPPGTSSVGTSFHVGFALPEKKPRKFKVSQFSVSVKDSYSNLKAEAIGNVSNDLAQNLEQENLVTMGRTAARVVIRTVAAQKAKRAMRTGNTLVDLITNVGTDVAQSQLEQADLRVGLFLPNTIHLTRIPVPEGSHVVNVRALNQSGGAEQHFEFKKDVPKNGKTFVIVPAFR